MQRAQKSKQIPKPDSKYINLCNSEKPKQIIEHQSNI